MSLHQRPVFDCFPGKAALSKYSLKLATQQLTFVAIYKIRFDAMNNNAINHVMPLLEMQCCGYIAKHILSQNCIPRPANYPTDRAWSNTLLATVSQKYID